MIERPKTDYNGRELVFHEDDDEWHCWALKLKARSIKALKRKIDKLDGEARRVSLPALKLDHYGRAVRADIVMIAKPKDWENGDWQRGQPSGKRPTVWVLVADGNQQKREKTKLDNCIAPTESNYAALKEVDRLRAEANALEEQAKGVIAAIPRLTLDDLTAKGAAEENLDGDDE
jgi:hypothetical protein